MYMFCCFAKIIYYVILILYHSYDIYFDCNTLSLIYNDGTFAGASIKGFFMLSFLIGFFCSIAIILVYLYYIIFHLSCICEECDSPGGSCDKTCNRRFVSAELVISLLELFLKDDVESGILFSIVMSETIVTPLIWQPVTSAICSVFGHLKLLICFVTKLCGCGEGEGDASCEKIVACFVGILGSALFLCFTIAYLVYVPLIAELRQPFYGREAGHLWYVKLKQKLTIFNDSYK